MQLMSQKMSRYSDAPDGRPCDSLLNSLENFGSLHKIKHSHPDTHIFQDHKSFLQKAQINH